MSKAVFKEEVIPEDATDEGLERMERERNSKPLRDAVAQFLHPGPWFVQNTTGSTGPNPVAHPETNTSANPGTYTYTVTDAVTRAPAHTASRHTSPPTPPNTDP